jgi:hypothetical protein
MRTSKTYPQPGRQNHCVDSRSTPAWRDFASVTSTFPSLIECERQANPWELNWSYARADGRKGDI